MSHNDSSDEPEKHAGGRPLKFQSVEDLDRRIKAYFRYCDPHITTKKVLRYPTITDEKGLVRTDEYGIPEIIKMRVMSEQQPYTVTGLALFLGTTRETLLDYEDRDEFSDTIKAAKLKIEAFAEGNLYSGKAVAGTIFSLANNFGWKNKIEQENTGQSKVVIETRHHKGDDADD